MLNKTAMTAKIIQNMLVHESGEKKVKNLKTNNLKTKRL